MRVYVARHGHKASQEPGYDGGFNTPLSERGEREAERLAGFLEGEALDALYSSCHLRALQTAAPVARRVEGPWHGWPVFCEGSRDTWGERRADGTDAAVAWRTEAVAETPTAAELEAMHGNYYLLSEVPERFPGVELSQPFPWPDAWWVPLEGQVHTDAYARVSTGAEALRERHGEGDRVAVVCHGISGEMLATELMGYPWTPERRIAFDTAGIIRLDRLESGRWRIVYLNRTCHLE